MAHTSLQASHPSKDVQVSVACTTPDEGALIPTGSVSRWTGQVIEPTAERQATCICLHVADCAAKVSCK